MTVSAVYYYTVNSNVGGHSCQFSNIEPAAMGKGGGMFHNLNDWEDAIVPSVTAAVVLSYSIFSPL